MGWIPSAKQTWQQTSPGNSVYQKMEICLGDFPVPSWVTRGLKAAIFQGREALKEVLEQWRLRGSWSGESVFQRCLLDSVGWQKSLVYLTKKAGRLGVPKFSTPDLKRTFCLNVWTILFFFGKTPCMCWSNSFPGAPTLQLASLLICKWVFESMTPKWSFLLNSCFTLKPWSKLNCKNRYRKFMKIPWFPQKMIYHHGEDFPHPDPANQWFLLPSPWIYNPNPSPFFGVKPCQSLLFGWRPYRHQPCPWRKPCLQRCSGTWPMWPGRYMG